MAYSIIFFASDGAETVDIVLYVFVYVSAIQMGFAVCLSLPLLCAGLDFRVSSKPPRCVRSVTQLPFTSTGSASNEDREKAGNLPTPPEYRQTLWTLDATQLGYQQQIQEANTASSCV